MSAEEAWHLKIPIRLSLAQDEISSPGDVKPIYVLAPRFAYLPALAQQCLSFFQHVLLNLPGQAASSSPWFEYEGLALSWTQPLGVLHDLLTPQPAAAEIQQQPLPGQQVAAGFSTSAIPWCLTVHYRNQPATLANSWQNSGTAKDHFFSSLKEAGYCCRGTDGCNAVMRLPGPVQDELWTAINRGDATAVRQHITPLRLTPSQRQGSSIPTVPVRLYIRRHKPGHTAGLLGLWSEVYSSSRAMEMQQPDGSATLLAHLVHVVMPQHFPAPQPQPSTAGAAGASVAAAKGSGSQQQPDTQLLQQQGSTEQHAQGAVQQAADVNQQQQCSVSGADTAPGSLTHPQQGPDSDPLGVIAGTDKPAAAGDDGKVPEALTQSAAAGGPGLSSSKRESSTSGAVLPPGWPLLCTVYVCGVQPDWCTPLGWLHANLKAADGFLYLVVHLEV